MTSVEWMAVGEHEVPADDEWLSVRERAWLDRMRFPKRRLEYRLARWGAKAAVAAAYDGSLAGPVEIGHLPEGAPAGYVAGTEISRRISMTDRAGWAVCAVAPPGVEVGVDLELVEPRSSAFVRDYFTPAEQAVAINGAEPDPVVANLVWSAKESVLKVLRTGLRRDTRTVEVAGGPVSQRAWVPFTATADGDPRSFAGWWRRFGAFLLTIAADSPTPPPRVLEGRGLETARPVHSWLERPQGV
jgi:4'-phosphopantetheinyl transferase